MRMRKEPILIELFSPEYLEITICLLLPWDLTRETRFPTYIFMHILGLFSALKQHYNPQTIQTQAKWR